MSSGVATDMPERLRRAREIVGWYTLAAIGTGAVPVPAASIAVIANNGFMLAHVGATMGAVVTWEGVVASLGIAGTLNVAGRGVFVEAGKALAWGTGSVWAMAGLCAAGAGTAGLQTYILGLIAIEMARNGGQPIDAAHAAQVIARGKETLGDFVAEMKATNPPNPGLPSAEAQTSVEAALPEASDKDGVFVTRRALVAMEDAGSAIRDAASRAADAIGAGATSAGSAITGLAAGAVGAVGSAFHAKPDTSQPDPADAGVDQQ